ncbi:putative E3 ubiquitin ligase RBR family [Helianthus annuus]|nr:putative E3 ubiquitin ligase RBR family [Helianthus annuus]
MTTLLLGYMKSHKLKSTGETKLKSLATKKKGWSECINCKNLVELAFGCFHVYCWYLCGYEFCFIIGY